MSDGQLATCLSREEIAKREIGHTDISRGLAWVMTCAFLATLVVPPTVQLVADLRQAGTSKPSACGELLSGLPAVAKEYVQGTGNRWNRLLAANRRLLHEIEEYEKQLADRSLLTGHLLGPTQQLLTDLAGLGNEKAFIGRDGWLFYRPDVEYLTGPGFLEPVTLGRRAKGGKQHAAPPQPDPRPAILEFHEQLARRGIRLILVPMPGKAAVHPDKLSLRFSGRDALLDNASLEQFKQEMHKGGVLVFDPAPLLVERRAASGGASQFLRTDTHWTPAAMQAVAEGLQEFINLQCPLPDQQPVDYGERILEIENLGDVAAMLHLPEQQTLFLPEKVAIRHVVQPDGNPWESDESADILLLGDSYANIYSLPEMNWGVAAGLAERVSFALRRPVDRLAQNAGGSHAVRQALFQQLAQGHDRLAGKRVVIWEFAVRELAVGDWKRFPMPQPAPAGEAPARERVSPPPGGELLVRGTVQSAAGAPQPGSVPYRDAITSVHLVNVEPVHAEPVRGERVNMERGSGALPNTEIVVYLWGMRDNRWTSAARFTAGQKLTLRLTPWQEVQSRLGRFNRVELDDPDFALVELPTFWAEDVP